MERLDQHWVEQMGGSRAVSRVLVANNGNAAIKAIMSWREWEALTFPRRALEVVCLATKDDIEANAEYISHCDKLVEVPAGANSLNFANVTLLAQLCEDHGCDALWPGWGHASEWPELPEALRELTPAPLWVGPVPESMRLLGDKIDATLLAQTANVSVVPWSGDGLTLDMGDKETLKARSMVTTPEQAVQECTRLGCPVMLKAAEGGGGRGIRRCNHIDEVAEKFRQVTTEVAGPVFAMRCVDHARHLEVQIAADLHGDVVALRSRECSVQRRHQKIIEEGPVLCLSPELEREMENDAVKLCTKAGYTGLGTVEFLFDPQGAVYFLEVNTRLQVEHPVTEQICGVNLPALQLQLAMGIPLKRIPQIQEFRKNRSLNVPCQHVMACRITSEDPDRDWQPTTGQIDSIFFRPPVGVFGYFAVRDPGAVHRFADSQFGHIFASAPTREEARRKLLLSLQQLQVRGSISTNIELLREKLLVHPSFVANDIDTMWLDSVPWRDDPVRLDSQQTLFAVLCAAVWHCAEYTKRCEQQFAAAVERGQRPTAVPTSQAKDLVVSTKAGKRKFCVKTTLRGKQRYVVEMNQHAIDVEVRAMSATTLLLCGWCDGKSRSAHFKEDPQRGLEVTVEGTTWAFIREEDPTKVLAPYLGKLVRWLVPNHAPVASGQAICEVEVMKLLVPLKSGFAGTLSHACAAGVTVEAGTLLATLELEEVGLETTQVHQTGWPAKTADDLVRKEVRMGEVKDQVQAFLEGYPVPEQDVVTALRELDDAWLEDPGQLVLFLAQATETLLGSLQLAADLERGDRPSATPSLVTAVRVQQRLVVVGKVFTMLLVRVQQLLGDRLHASTLQQALTEPLRSPLAALGRLGAEKATKCLDLSYHAKRLLLLADAPLLRPALERADDPLSFDQEDALLHCVLNGGPHAARAAQHWARLKGEQRPRGQSEDDASTPTSQKPNAVQARGDQWCVLAWPQLDRGLDAPKVARRLQSARPGETHEELAREFPGLHYLRRSEHAIERLACACVFRDAAELDSSLGEALRRCPASDLPLRLVVLGPVEDKQWEQALARVRPQFSSACCQHALGGSSAWSPQLSARTFELLDGPQEQPMLLNVPLEAWDALELPRMDPFVVEKVPVSPAKGLKPGPDCCPADFVHCFVATPRSGGAQRVFVRSVVPRQVLGTTAAELRLGVEYALAMSLFAVEDALKQKFPPRHRYALPRNHLLLTLQLEEDLGDIGALLLAVAQDSSARFAEAQVAQVELRVTPHPHHAPGRFVLDASEAKLLKLRAYVEVQNPVDGSLVLSEQHVSATAGPSSRDGEPVLAAHPVEDALDERRSQAKGASAPYAYDLPKLLEAAVLDQWKKSKARFARFGSFVPEKTVEAWELVELAEDTDELEEVVRAPGHSKCGMVAWLLLLRTPEYPEGRQVVLVASDLTYQIGSFSLDEDRLYVKASKLARQRGLPRIYVASNSGARLGIDKAVLDKVQLKWREQGVSAGLDYLFLSPEDARQLGDAVRTTPAHHPELGPVEMLTDVIGKGNGLGVENLVGSGMIAGESSLAYREIFTLTVVLGRTVGIGAYVARLCQRIVQKRDSPILLTGFQALNNLIGSSVYTSNDEIGGPGVMGANGISHQVVDTDVDAMEAVLDWLSFVPKVRGGALPITPSVSDPAQRDVMYRPQLTDDPRLLLTGVEQQPGLLDAGTFIEMQLDWAKSVICGRGRLGGIPVGVIVAETRPTETILPADPADPQSTEQRRVCAGSVWYPDSSYKTAQAIEDFNEEELPLIILAHWRGFSGGRRDMFQEVLKFGSMIVDGLVKYKQPVFVYLPPSAELRGGSWVVLDTNLNPNHMSVYAAPESRAGVLEPSGMAGLKLKRPELVKWMERTDPELIQLRKQDAELAEAGLPPDDKERKEVKDSAQKRIQEAQAPYHLAAEVYCDLHDTPARMAAKKAIKAVVPWREARSFFFWQLRKQLIVFNIRQQLVHAKPGLTLEKATKEVLSWFPQPLEETASSAQQFVTWSQSDAAFATIRKNLRCDR